MYYAVSSKLQQTHAGTSQSCSLIGHPCLFSKSWVECWVESRLTCQDRVSETDGHFTRQEMQRRSQANSCQGHQRAPELGSFDVEGWSSGCRPTPSAVLLPLLLLMRRRMRRSALLRRRKDAELPAARMRREAAAGWLDPAPGVCGVAREERVDWLPLASALGGDFSEGEAVPTLGLYMACATQRTLNKVRHPEVFLYVLHSYMKVL